MSSIVLGHGKIHSHTKGVAAAHNHRLSTTPQPNINSALTHLNRYSAKDGASSMVDKINARLPDKRRKDAVEAIELIMSASPAFFDAIETDREKLNGHPKFRQWVKDTIDWVKKEFGQNVVDISLHMDEKTPHLHVVTMPLVDGRLCAKEVMSRANLIRRHDDYAAAMGKYGLERGVSISESGVKPETLKEGRRKKLEKEIAELKKTVTRSATVQAERDAKLTAGEKYSGVVGMVKAVKETLTGREAELLGKVDEKDAKAALYHDAMMDERKRADAADQCKLEAQHRERELVKTLADTVRKATSDKADLEREIKMLKNPTPHTRQSQTTAPAPKR